MTPPKITPEAFVQFMQKAAAECSAPLQSHCNFMNEEGPQKAVEGIINFGCFLGSFNPESALTSTFTVGFLLGCMFESARVEIEELKKMEKLTL